MPLNINPRTRVLGYRLSLILLFGVLTGPLLGGAFNVKLVGNSNACCGRVESNVFGWWRAVCAGYHWDMRGAQVVCRQLGCGQALSASGRTGYLWGSVRNSVKYIGCSGHESFFTQCISRRPETHDCYLDKLASVTCSGDLKSPTLTSSHSAVSPGETIQFRCTKPNASCVSADFRLYRDGTVIRTQRAESTTTFDLTVDPSHQGQYSCDYSYQGNGLISSPMSSSVGITVVAIPTPQISVSPTSQVTWGKSVDITCSIKTQYTGGTFTLLKHGSLIQTKSGTSVIFTFPKVDFVHEGFYYCQYQTTVSTRDFSSPLSSSVGFSVVVNLQNPSISFGSPDERFYQGSQKLVVTRGYGFSIICSTDPQYPGGSFYLEFSGSNISRTQSADNHSTTFIFPEADFDHQRNYSCFYEVNVSTRSFRSNSTELLVVTVKASLAPFIGSGVAAALLLILLPVSICFIKRLKEQNQTDEKMEHRQCAKNAYEFTSGKDMDDDNIYENVETTFQQQEDSDDSDDDYVNVQNMADDNDYKGEQIYSNCAE